MNSTLKLLSTTVLLTTLAACGGGGGSDSGSSGGGTPPQTFSVSVTLTGLASGKLVTLQNNGSDTIELDENYNDSSYTFVTEIADQSTYDVTVSVQPTGQTCVAENGSGTIDRMTVTSITVECVDGSYSKINSDGDEVLSTADDWDCVMDNDSSLMWEVKTTGGRRGLRDSSWTYTWYDTNSSTNGGDHGIGDTGVGTTTGYQTPSYTYGGSDNCSDSSRCDTKKYAEDINLEQLCNYSNWRMPTKDELAGLLSCTPGYCDPASAILIDQIYFPNTQGYWFWSSKAYAYPSNVAHIVGFGFNYGGGSNANKDSSRYVRLVRDSQ